MASSEEEECGIWELLRPEDDIIATDLVTLVLDPSTPLLRVLEDATLLQELMSRNSEVISFFTEPSRLSELLHLFLFPSPNGPMDLMGMSDSDSDDDVDSILDKKIHDTSDADDDPTVRFLYRVPYICSQVLQCDIPEINHILSTNCELIRTFFSFLMRCPEDEDELESAKRENPALLQYFIRVACTLFRNKSNYVGLIRYCIAQIADNGDVAEEDKETEFLEGLFFDQFGVFRFEFFVLALVGIFVKEDQGGKLVPFEYVTLSGNQNRNPIQGIGMGMPVEPVGSGGVSGIGDGSDGVLESAGSEATTEVEEVSVEVEAFERTRNELVSLLIEKNVFVRLVSVAAGDGSESEVDLEGRVRKIEYGRNVFLLLRCIVMFEEKMPVLFDHFWTDVVPMIASKITLDAESGFVMKHYLSEFIFLVSYIVDYVQETGFSLLFGNALDGESDDAGSVPETLRMKVRRDAFVAILEKVGRVLGETLVPLLMSENLSTHGREAILSTIARYGTLAWRLNQDRLGDGIVSTEMLKNGLSFFERFPQRSVVHGKVVALFVSVMENMNPSLAVEFVESSGLLDFVVSLSTKRDNGALGAPDCKFRLSRSIIRLQDALMKQNGTDLANRSCIGRHVAFLDYVERDMPRAQQIRDRHLEDARAKTSLFFSALPDID